MKITSAQLLLEKASATSDPAVSILMAKKSLKLAESAHNLELTTRCLNYISRGFWMLGKTDSVRFYAKTWISLAEKHPIETRLGDAWVFLGLSDYQDNNYEQSIQKYQKAIVLYQKERNIPAMATTYKNIGICQSKLSKYTDAIRIFLKSANSFQKLKDSLNLASTYNSIGLDFVSLSNFPKAIFYSKTALAIRKQLKDERTIAQSLNNIGYAYKEFKKPDSAILYLTQCLEMRKAERDSNILVPTLQNLGEAWLMKQQLAKAEFYISRSVRISNAYQMTEELGGAKLAIANVYFAQKKYSRALNSATIAENTAQKLKLSDMLLNAYVLKSKSYKQSADYKNALMFLEKANILKDSLFTTEKDRAIAELEISYQSQQKEKNIELLQTQNKLQQKTVAQQWTSIIGLSVGAILLGSLFAVAYVNFRNKNRANFKIQTLMQDLHHRVKNNLQILAGLFSLQINSSTDESTKNVLRENEARLLSMNLIHHELYMNQTSTQIEMHNYLHKLLHHLKFAFGASSVSFDLDVDTVVMEAEKAVAVGLIVNELVTNAMKHAFDAQGGTIKVSLLNNTPKSFLLTLSDNGKGMQSQTQVNPSSFGLKLVNLMAKQLNSTLKTTTQNGMCYQLEIAI